MGLLLLHQEYPQAIQMSGNKKGGKFHKKNPYRDRKEFKSDEIKKSLAHRARLRKNYFKIMEKEGTPVEKQSRGGSKKEGTENEGDYEDTNEVDDFKYSKDSSSHKPKAEQRKPMNFAERAKIAKDRKEAARKEKLQDIRDRRQVMERKSKEREFKKERFSKRTQSGQPLMGPRINNLLDKIKSEMS